MTLLHKLSLKCIQESLQHNRHTNVYVNTISADAVCIVSDTLISLAFVYDGVIVSDTIVNNKNSSYEELVLDYIDEY